MIVDFPEAKQKIKQTYDTILRQQVKQKAPTWSMGSRKMLFEGDKLAVFRADGTKDVSEMRAAQSEFSIPREDIQNVTAEDMVEKLSAAAEDMAGQIERGLFETLNDAVDKSGNWIPGNPALTPEGILQGLERIWIEFEDDDREKPIKPTIIAAPEAVEKLMQAAEKETKEDKQQYYEKEKVILDRKYKEYMADLSSRKLID